MSSALPFGDLHLAYAELRDGGTAHDQAVDALAARFALPRTLTEGALYLTRCPLCQSIARATTPAGVMTCKWDGCGAAFDPVALLRRIEAALDAGAAA